MEARESGKPGKKVGTCSRFSEYELVDSMRPNQRSWTEGNEKKNALTFPNGGLKHLSG